MLRPAILKDCLTRITDSTSGTKLNCKLHLLTRRVALPERTMSCARAIEITEQVYGKYTGEQQWTPRAYDENKSRYLWTDAFGIVNYITLACETGDAQYLDQADALIKAVHDILGKDRNGIQRLNGATDDHPTKGGLRIGKKHPEGHPDGDGMYLHYVTKHAFALNRMSIVRNDPKYNQWAIELMEAVHPHFVYRDSMSGALHSHWKISTDMKRPLVPSEGNLDPYDGLVTCQLLRKISGSPETTLAAEEADYRAMVEAKYKRYRSNDPLDLGEALWLSHWGMPNEDWAKLVAKRSLEGINMLWNNGYFNVPEEYGRLAFREFGTTLGLQVNEVVPKDVWMPRVHHLHQFWNSRLNTRDVDITPVMFVSSLVPGAWNKEYESKLRIQTMFR